MLVWIMGECGCGRRCVWESACMCMCAQVHVQVSVCMCDHVRGQVYACAHACVYECVFGHVRAGVCARLYMFG